MAGFRQGGEDEEEEGGHRSDRGEVSVRVRQAVLPGLGSGEGQAQRHGGQAGHQRHPGVPGVRAWGPGRVHDQAGGRRRSRTAGGGRMSEWRVEVVRVGPVEAHPDADRLEITRVHGGYPCIVAKGQLSEGARAVYLPVDSLVPADEERWACLGRGRTPTVVDGRPYWRIRALRLRGVFSMGVLVGVPADMADAEAGDLVHERLGVLKYEPPEPVSMGGEDERDPGFLPHYDVEALRRHPDVLIPGADVVVTEKIHGASGRWAWREGRLWVASHACFKKAPAD